MARTLDQYRFRHSFALGGSKATERSMIDLKKALAEVDGLFAGFRYADKIDQAFDGCSPASTATLCSSEGEDIGHTQAFLRDSSLSRLDLDVSQVINLNTTDTEQIIERCLNNHGEAAHNGTNEPGALQWAAVRSLREAMNRHFDSFRTVCLQSNSPILKKLLESYSGAKGMREDGILTFRDLLTGQTPTTLKAIFAFASLSYVISKLLVERKQISDDQILDGLVVWKNAISDRAENEAFRYLARSLWPESKHVLHAFPLPDIPPLEAQCPNPRLSRFFEAPQVSPATPNDATYGDGAEYSAENPTMGPEVNPDSSDNCFFRTEPDVDMRDVYHGLQRPEVYAYDLTGYMAEGVGFSAFTIPHVANFELQTHDFDDQVDLNHLLPREVPRPPPKAPPPRSRGDIQISSSDMLEDTPMFRILFNFFHYMSNLGDELGDLFYHLSGEGVKTESFEQGGLSEAHVKSKFERKMQKNFFDPLRSSFVSSNRQPVALLAVAKAFVRLGLFRTLDQIQRYLCCISDKLMPSSELYTEFSRAVLNPPRPGRRAENQSHINIAPKVESYRPQDSRVAPQPTDRRFPCSHRCGKVYTSRANRRRHERISHEEHEKISCPYQGCTRINDRRDLVRQHFRTMHPDTPLPPLLSERRRKMR